MVVHVARQAESVIYKDKDIIAFVPDRLDADISTMTAHDRDGGELVCNMGTAPSLGERVLMYGRAMPDGSFPSGLRACVYRDGTGTDCKILREIISHSVTYDRASNVLSLWFWTNFEVEPTDYDDTDGTLYWIDENDFDSSKKAWRALCFARGSIHRYYVSGGVIEDGTTPPFADPSYDLMPVFEKPRIMAVRLMPLDDSDGVPIIDFAGTGGGSACDPPTNPKDISYVGEHITPARTGSVYTWNRDSDTDNDGFKVTVTVGVAFHNGDFYTYVQDFLYDACGALYSVSEERRIAIATTVTWSDCS